MSILMLRKVRGYGTIVVDLELYLFARGRVGERGRIVLVQKLSLLLSRPWSVYISLRLRLGQLAD
jgi:hypothetical protein